MTKKGEEFLGGDRKHPAKESSDISPRNISFVIENGAWRAQEHVADLEKAGEEVIQEAREDGIPVDPQEVGILQSLSRSGKQAFNRFRAVMQDIQARVTRLQAESVEKARVRQQIREAPPLEGEAKRELTLGSEKIHYQAYLKDFGLEEEELHDKTIADIGAGDRFFASYCIRNNINSEVYSVAPEFEAFPPEIADVAEQVEEKTRTGVMEDLPFRNEQIDLILDRAALPGITEWMLKRHDRLEENVDRCIDEMVRVLRVGGEARLCPFRFKETKGKVDPIHPQIKYILEKVQQLQAEGLVAMELEDYQESTLEIPGVFEWKPEGPVRRLIIRKLRKIS